MFNVIVFIILINRLFSFTVGFMDVSPLRQIAPWTFRPKTFRPLVLRF